MKIIIFSSFYGNGYGLGYSAYKEAEEFCAQGYEVTLVCIDRKKSIQHHPNLKLIYLPKSKHVLLDVLDYFFKLKKFIAEYNLNNFDIVYIQSLEFGLLNFSKIKTPVIYFSRSTIKGLKACYKKYFFRKNLYKYFIDVILIVLEKRLFCYSRRVIVKSKRMQTEIAQLYHISKNKIDIIEGGIDSQDFNLNISKDQFHIFCKKHNLKVNNRILLYAGRIVPQKGLIDLIKAMAILNEKENFKLLIAGKPLNTLYYKELINLIAKLKLNDKVIFIGHIDQLEMRVLISLSEAVISPSLYEPFGMINLQAAVMGKVVITTNIVGSNDLLNKYKKILIVSPNSATCLAAAINKIDLVKTNRDKFNFSEYSWFNIANKILDIFKKYSKLE